jgi:hypothetical protein
MEWMIMRSPLGISSEAVRNSAELNDPRRRLPEIPISVVTVFLLSWWSQLLASISYQLEQSCA